MLCSALGLCSPSCPFVTQGTSSHRALLAGGTPRAARLCLCSQEHAPGHHAMCCTPGTGMAQPSQPKTRRPPQQGAGSSTCGHWVFQPGGFGCFYSWGLGLIGVKSPDLETPRDSSKETAGFPGEAANCFDSVEGWYYHFYVFFVQVKMNHLPSPNTMFKHLKCLNRALFLTRLSHITQLSVVVSGEVFPTAPGTGRALAGAPLGAELSARGHGAGAPRGCRGHQHRNKAVLFLPRQAMVLVLLA